MSEIGSSRGSEKMQAHEHGVGQGRESPQERLQAAESPQERLQAALDAERLAAAMDTERQHHQQRSFDADRHAERVTERSSSTERIQAALSVAEQSRATQRAGAEAEVAFRRPSVEGEVKGQHDGMI